MYTFPVSILIVHTALLASMSEESPGVHQDEATITVTYSPDDSPFPNPERGFYSYQSLDNLNPSIFTLREDRGITLVWGKISLNAYRETEILPDALIEKLQQGFDLARMAGVKIIVRIKYGNEGPDGSYRSYEDPEINIMEGHIIQLAPLFSDNVDVIAFFEAGMVGPWGEWHSTTIARNPELRRRMFFSIMDNTPEDRMVVLRYPALKQSIFETDQPLDPALAYNGSHIARAAHHNDCFLSSENDVGTYNRGHMTMEEELAYLSAETRNTLFGGESCRLHDRSRRENALRELERLHASYLNSGYFPEVLERWREEGTLDIVERRLGARFVLESFQLPARARPGQNLLLRLSLTNTGFASLYNPRPVYFVLTSEEGRKWLYPLEQDPRFWKPGEPVDLKSEITLPFDLEPGNYQWSLYLPDPSLLLEENPAYAYRLANTGVWDEALGENILLKDWPIVISPVH